MIVNRLLNTYFIYYQNQNLIMNKEEFDFFIQDKMCNILINNSDYIDRIEGVVDIRILNWLINNYSDYNYLSYIETVIPKNIELLVEQQKKHINENKMFLNQAKEYTRYYKVLNRLFRFDYNKEYLFKLKEKYFLKQHIHTSIKGYVMDVPDVSQVERGIKYSFLNSTGKIYSNNNLLQKIDRKNHIELFKTRKDRKYYLVDFVSFEPAVLYFYTKNEEYRNKDFYDKYADKLYLNRDEFKSNFLAYLNGAGYNSLGSLLEIFNNEFKDIVILRDKIQGGLIINMFKHSMFYEKDYKKMNVLIVSSSYDYLLRFYNYIFYIYGKNQNQFIFRWNLFDEILVECDKDFDIEGLFKKSKLNFKIKEY